MLRAMDRTRSNSDTDAPRGRRPAPWLVLAMEYQRPLAAPVRFGLAGVQEVIIGRGPGRRSARGLEGGRICLTLAVADDRMSTRHARLRLRGAAWELVDLGSRNGTWVNGERVDTATVGDGDLIEAGNTMFLLRVDPPGEGGQPEPCDAGALEGEPAALRTLRPGLAARFAVLDRVATSGVSVLVGGATGTGKELLARAVHQRSGRGGPFVAVNCGAIPDSLVESQLFGHVRGAFSGADRDRTGLVQASDGGTLFLDEVAELSLPSQVALLRVLQEAEVTPVGATAPVPVDLRVVAATHQDLDARVAAGSFREDLYARLAGFVIELPDLVDRREDLGLLVGALLRRHAAELAATVRLHRSAGRALFAYAWPRNVRELEAALRSALAVAAGAEIHADHLPEAIRAHGPVPAAAPTPADETLRARMLELLDQHAGNVSAAARALGHSRAHFHRLMKRLGISPEAFRR